MFVADSTKGVQMDTADMEKIVAMKNQNVAGQFPPRQIGSGGKVCFCAVGDEKSGLDRHTF